MKQNVHDEPKKGPIWWVKQELVSDQFSPSTISCQYNNALARTVACQNNIQAFIHQERVKPQRLVPNLV